MLKMNRRSALQSIALAISLGFGAPAKAKGRSVVLVATQKAGDQGPIDELIAGLKQAKAEFGVNTRFIAVLDPAAYENTLRTLARRGTDVVVTTFFAMGAALQTVAPEFPNTRFVAIVAAPLDPLVPNVRTTVYTDWENTYLAGVFGATMSETGKLGLIGGVPLPDFWATYNAMEAGAKTVNEDATVTAAFVQSFEDPAKGKEVAASLYDKGIDVAFTGASASDIGVVEAAKKLGKTVIAASPALVRQAPENVGFIASFEWARTLMLEVKNALSEDFQAGARFCGISSGEILMTFPDTYAAVHPKAAAAQKATEETYAAIASGTFTVPHDASEHKA